MATLPGRDRITNPRNGVFHIVKAGKGVQEYSFQIGYQDFLSAIKEDHPIVVGIYATKNDLPSTNVNLGTLAIVRDENRIYVYDTDGWIPGSNSSSEELTVENTTVYDPNEIYKGGNIFVSFVNEASSDPLFQDAAIYRSRKETVAGVSPEDDLYDPDTNIDGKWEYQGSKVTLQSGGLAKIFFPDKDAIRAITDYKDGNNVVDNSTGIIYRYDKEATSGLQPNDNSESSGRWVEDGRWDEFTSQAIHNVSEKTTPVDADEVGLWDSVNVALRKITWANIKATLKLYFDKIYATISEAGLWEPDTFIAATTVHPRWNDSADPDIYGRDTFGFGALPAGRRDDSGPYYSIGGETSFWSSDADAADKVQLLLNTDSGWGAKNFFKANEGYPIRLVRDYVSGDGDKIDGRILSATFSDNDGNTYDGVIIGDQVLSTTNLKTTSYADGTAIPTGYTDTEWSNLTTGAYAVYDHTLVTGIDSEAEMIAAYGLLYNWYAVDNAAGLSSDGAVPTDAQFTQLTDYIIANYPDIDSTNIGDHLKSVRQVNSPYEAESDEYIKPKDGKKVKPEYLEGNVATTKNVAFSTNIPFNSILTSMPLTASDAERVFAPITADAIAGGRCIVTLTADGNSANVPGFDPAFKQSPDSMIWSNVTGTNNTIDFWYDGTTYWYKIIRDESNIAYKSDVLLKGGASGPFTPTHDDDPVPKKWTEDQIKQFVANYYPGQPSPDGEDLGWYGVEWDEGRVNSGCIRTGSLSGYRGGGAYGELGYNIDTRPLSNIPENLLFVHNKIKSVMLKDDGTENYDLDQFNNYNKSGVSPSVTGTVTTAGTTSLISTGAFTGVEDDYKGRYVHITTSGKLNIYCLITGKVSDDELSISDPRNGSPTADIFAIDDTFEICTARFDGVDGQAMVKIPKFYYFMTFETSPVDSSKSLVKLGVSLYPYDSFSVYPAFIDGNNNEVDAIYYSKFEAIPDVSTLASLPNSLPQTDQTIGTFRTEAQSRGAGWQQEMFWYRSAIQMLFYVEYADLNSQMRLPAFTEGPGTSSWKRKTGRTLSAGNSSVSITADSFYDSDIYDSADWNEHETVAMCYRGIENLYGHIWTWLDGMNVNDYNVYVTNNKSVLDSDTFTGYDDLQVDLPGNNYFSEIHPIGGAIIPKSTGGSSVASYADYVWHGSGWRVALAGGHLYRGARAGVAALRAYDDSSYSDWIIGARLCF